MSHQNNHIINHRWIRVKYDWFIFCEEARDRFSPQHPTYNKHGFCPLCQQNARRELETRKKDYSEEARENIKTKKESEKKTLLPHLRR